MEKKVVVGPGMKRFISGLTHTIFKTMGKLLDAATRVGALSRNIFPEKLSLLGHTKFITSKTKLTIYFD